MEVSNSLVYHYVIFYHEESILCHQQIIFLLSLLKKEHVEAVVRCIVGNIPDASMEQVSQIIQ